MERMESRGGGMERNPGGECHHHYYAGWWWCWPGGATWCGAFIVAIGAGMILGDLEVFRGSEPMVWGIVLAAFGLYTLVAGPRGEAGPGAGR